MLGGIPMLRLGDQHVDGGNDEEGEESSDNHPGDQDNTDAVSGTCAGAGCKDQRRMPKDGGRRGHQDRSQACPRGSQDGVPFVHASLLEFIGKLNDQNAVFGDKSEEGNQSHLAVNVDACRT